jgi:Type II secretion system (T2SS), protein E, N-terminal domain
VSDEAIALAFRTGLPYVGLRDHEHDPELDDLVPPDAARSARVLPLTAADDHIRLAVADPEADLATLTPYLEGKRVELAIAPREELEEILGRPPPEPPAEPAAAPTNGIEEEAAAEPAPVPADSIEDEPVVAEAAPLAAEPDSAAPAEADAAAPPEVEPLDAAPAEAEPLADEPAPTDGIEEEVPAEAGTAPTDGIEEEAPAEAGTAPADGIEEEALAAEPDQAAEPDSAAPAEAEPLAAELAAPAEAEPLAAEPAAAAAPVVEHYAFAPDEPAGEAPSWLAPPPKRRWLRAIGRFLLYVLVLALVCGAVAAYLLTR